MDILIVTVFHGMVYLAMVRTSGLNANDSKENLA